MSDAQSALEQAKRDIGNGARADLTKTKLSLLEELLNGEHRVCVTHGKRTPFVNAMRNKKSAPPFLESNALDMASFTVKELMADAKLEARDINKLGFATVLPDRGIPAFGPALETKLGLRDTNNPNQKLAIDRRANCITSLVIAQNIIEAMLLYGLKVGIAGGVEKMSSAALMVDSEWEKLLIRSQQSPNFKWRRNLLSIPRKNPFNTQRAENIFTGLSMGQSCELMVRDFGITALEQAQFAVTSHRNAAIAQAKGYLAEEIAPYLGISTDTLIRPDTDIASIMRLKPTFRTPGIDNPTINAATSSPLTDGAAAVVLMTEAEANARGATPLAFITGIEEAKVSDYNREGLLMAPAYAIARLLERHALKIADIDFFELHEPFAAQFLCINKMVGPFPIDKVNPNGGAIAIGHPFAASGARYLLSVSNEVHRRSKELGRPVTALIAVCANEGEGMALLLRS
ncbi:MAG: thiolase family protein [Planctomycetota bacterium]|jgi:acetyl-CoA C-acetyltransferase